MHVFLNPNMDWDLPFRLAFKVPQMLRPEGPWAPRYPSNFLIASDPAVFLLGIHPIVLLVHIENDMYIIHTHTTYTHMGIHCRSKRLETIQISTWRGLVKMNQAHPSNNATELK